MSIGKLDIICDLVGKLTIQVVLFSKGSGDINVLKLFDIESFTMEREDITRKIVRGKFAKIFSPNFYPENKISHQG